MTEPSAARRTLPGFTSRCTRPWTWAWWRAPATWAQGRVPGTAQDYDIVQVLAGDTITGRSVLEALTFIYCLLLILAFVAALAN